MSSAALPHEPRPNFPLAAGHGRRISRDAVGIAIATGAYALSFGAISVASGLNPAQTQTLSLLMFTGGSQFALVGVLGAGGGALAAVVTAWLLGGRNSLYALATAMALAHPEPPAAARRAFWHTGIAIFVLWNIGTLVGALGCYLEKLVGHLLPPSILQRAGLRRVAGLAT